MKPPASIPKNPQLSVAQDYAALRKKGIESIQRLAGDRWTDHNTHDPGITLLEAFCYNLTELTLKADLDVTDVMASGHAAGQQAFFLPEQVFPTAPNTVEDYRKTLIDMEGVRNAWLIPLDASVSGVYQGLYNLLLELEEDELLGDLNGSIIRRTFSLEIHEEVRDYTIEVSFPFWDSEEASDFQELLPIDTIQSVGESSVVLTTLVDGDEQAYYSELTLLDSITSTIGQVAVTIRVQPSIGGDATENEAVEDAIREILGQTQAQDPNFLPICAHFNQKVVRAHQIKNRVREHISQHRNLGEDLNQIDAIRLQEIGINAKIDLIQDLAPDQLLAHVIVKLENFFKPEIIFQSLADFDENMAWDELFEGPLLENGFLHIQALGDSEKGAQGDRNSRVYVSDLLHIITQTALELAGIEGNTVENQPIAVSNISISSFIRNKFVVKRAKDCLNLVSPERIKARFSFAKSQISFFRNGIEVPINLELTQAIIQGIRAASQSMISEVSFPALPTGEKLPISTYHSIQYDFPAAYGLAQNLLPEQEPLAKRAKVEQFRAYVSLADQLLAGFNNQLSNVNSLFSIEPTINQSYFPSTLYEVPHIAKLLQAYLDQALSWEDFIQNSDNIYINALQDAAESKQLFLDRRNRFLDHLLGRFGFSFSEKDSLLIRENFTNINEAAEFEMRQTEFLHELMLAKTQLLASLPGRTQNRSQAFDYLASSWEATAGPALEQELLFAMGQTEDVARRNFTVAIANAIQIQGAGANRTFEILDRNQQPMLLSNTTYPDVASAEAAANEAIMLAIHRQNFQVLPITGPSGTLFQVGIQPDDNMMPSLIASAPILLETEWEARLSIRNLLREILVIGAGVHIVEHILLRPDPADNAPAELLIPSEDSETLQDPYSYQISVFFPSGYSSDFASDPVIEAAIPAHFQEAKFRDFLIRKLREKTPAHIVPYIFFLHENRSTEGPNTESIGNISNVWRSWLETKADSEASAADLQSAQNRLVQLMNAIFQL